MVRRRDLLRRLPAATAAVHNQCIRSQLPLAVYIMLRHQKRDYAAIFREISAMLPHCQLQRMVLDFERAARVVFPTVVLKGCTFHFTQAIWRRIQECGLQVAYGSDEGTFKFLRRYTKHTEKNGMIRWSCTCISRLVCTQTCCHDIRVTVD